MAACNPPALLPANVFRPSTHYGQKRKQDFIHQYWAGRETIDNLRKDEVREKNEKSKHWADFMTLYPKPMCVVVLREESRTRCWPSSQKIWMPQPLRTGILTIVEQHMATTLDSFTPLHGPQHNTRPGEFVPNLFLTMSAEGTVRTFLQATHATTGRPTSTYTRPGVEVSENRKTYKFNSESTRIN